MFDRVIAAKSQSRGWSTFLIVGTVAGHAAVLTALVLVAFWKIEKLPISDDREILLSLAPEAPPPGGPPPGEKLTVLRPAIPPKLIPDVPVQPTPPVVDPPAVTTGGGPAGTGPTGTNGTNPNGSPDSTEIGTGTCATPPCGKPDPIVEKVVIPPRRVDIVPPNVAAGLRITGNEKIYPPDSVRVSMVHADQDTLRATIKLCVDTAGAIESVKLMKSTGYGAYDALLTGAMRSWRYRPYQVNGVATAMCSVEVVIYRMTK